MCFICLRAPVLGLRGAECGAQSLNDYIKAKSETKQKLNMPVDY